MSKHQQGQRETLKQPQHHDRDQAHQRLAGTVVCPDCNASFSAGRWSWQAVDDPTEKATCPACKRIAENAPAGNVRLSGEFVEGHREELINLIRNTEKLECKDHALERLIGISEEDGGLMVGTTGTHLANRIGHALQAAYDGVVSYTYTDNETHLDVDWKRKS